MILKMCKKLQQKDTNKIREINKKLIFLRQLQDGPFLKEDLEQKTPLWQAENPHIEFLLDEKIGPIASVSSCAIKRTNSNTLCFYKEERKTERVNFALTLVKASYPKPLAARVIATIENMELHTRDVCIDPTTGGSFGNLYALATYFYNKLAAYKKIQNCLKKNVKNLEAQISETYVADLIKLFSVTAPRKPTKAFYIPTAFVSRENCMLNIPDIEAKAIALVEYAYFVKGHFMRNVEICLVLAENNILEYYIIPNYGVEIYEDQELLAFLNENTNNWLKNLETLASFGYALSKKVKTKLLINNI